MSIFSLGFLGFFAAAAGIASMTAAFERGDVDETARQGLLAGPVVVERGLADPARLTQLAAVTAAPSVEARAELLPSLATLAAGPDRRTAIPAAVAARTIARELAHHELADDIGSDDVSNWRARFEQIATNRNRFIEVRVLSLDVVASLAQVIAPDSLGFDLSVALGDPDPALRAAAVAVVPRPTPVALRAPLANAVIKDADTRVALDAAQALCGDDQSPATLAVLGPQGLDRIKKLVAAAPKKATRDAARCLKL